MSDNNVVDINPQQQAELSIEERSGVIILMLKPQNKRQKISYALLPPDQALAVGDTLARYAYGAKHGYNQGTLGLADQTREMLKNRIPHVIRSMERKKVTPEHIAQEIIDVILREIL